MKEIHLEVNPNEENRSERKLIEANLKRYLNIEEEYWRKKVGIRWFIDGDRNTKLFHAFVKEKKEIY